MNFSVCNLKWNAMDDNKRMSKREIECWNTIGISRFLGKYFRKEQFIYDCPVYFESIGTCRKFKKNSKSIQRHQIRRSWKGILEYLCNSNSMTKKRSGEVDWELTIFLKWRYTIVVIFTNHGFICCSSCIVGNVHVFATYKSHWLPKLSSKPRIWQQSVYKGPVIQQDNGISP